MSNSKTPVTLKPLAGFCIKTFTLQPALLNPGKLTEPTSSHLLEPAPRHTTIPISFKIFVNIAWDLNVPPPPAGDEEVIQRAIHGHDVDKPNSEGWYIPVVVSDARQDKDKAGRPSLVFDCVYNTSVKSRTLIDPEFKLFIIELALQRIEAQNNLSLSRQIGSPNIASKGRLSPRTVYIPSLLVNESSGSRNITRPAPLVQEVTSVTTPSAKPKAILKSTLSPTNILQTLNVNDTQPRLTWSWTKEDSVLQIKISLPHLPRAAIEQATLDIESRRLIVHIPSFPTLDIDLSLSDAEIVSTATARTFASLHGDMSEPNNTLTLKRQRDLDLDGAVAEWRIAESVLVVYA